MGRFRRLLLSALAAPLATALLVVAPLVAQATNRAPRIVTGEIAFTRQVLDDTMDETHAVAVADFDRDGLLDACATDFVDGDVIWYRNDGRGGFTRHVVDPGLDGAYPIGVGDVDRDGDPDIVAAGYVAAMFVWYENDGKGGFRRHNVGSSQGAHSIVVVDLDRDNDNDLLTSSQDAGLIAWYENDGRQGFKQRVIDAGARDAKRAEAADLDGDSDIDVVTANFDTREIAWYVNDGKQGFTKRVIDANAEGAYYVCPGDIDRDGDIDVVSATRLRGTIDLHENLGGGTFKNHRIDANALGARTVILADLDGDGDLDPIAASVDDNTIAWHVNDLCRGFRERLLDAPAAGAYGLAAIDFDGDGDIDLMSALRDEDVIALHMQIRRHPFAVAIAGRRVIDATVLMTVDADDSPSELTYALSRLPAAGRVELRGLPLALGGKFTQDDVDHGRVVYVHSGTGSGVDGFAFVVADGGEDGVRPASGDFVIAVTGAADAFVELPLDEGSGTVAHDASGNRHDGQLVNGATFDAKTPDGSRYALRLDGADDYVDLGTLDPRGSSLTLASWLNADTFGSGERRVISKATGIAANDHLFMLGTVVVSPGNVRVCLRVRSGGKTATLIAPRGNLRAATWHHAAGTYDGQTLRVYVDGFEVGSAPWSGAIDADPSVRVALGAQPPGAGTLHFDGLLDDVRLVRRALSASEIATLAAGARGFFRSYGAGLAGTGGVAPVLGGSGSTRLGQLAQIELSHGRPGTGGALVLGTSEAAIPAYGGWVLVLPWSVLLVAVESSGKCAGTTTAALRIPIDTALITQRVRWQAVLLDPAAPYGLALTQGLEMTVGR